MPDSGLGARWRNLARVLRGEAKVTAGALTALRALLTYSDKALRSSGYDPGILSAAAADWPRLVGTHVLPQIETVFTAAFEATQRGTLDVLPYQTRHMEAVTNRLVGVPDDVFDAMRLTIEAGRQEQESIPQIAARVDALLADEERWKGRATTIARTEVIGANNAGSYSAASATAAALGENPALVVKEWLATGDARTRPDHAAADGMQVRGMDAAFTVGGADLQYAGDPNGPGDQVINCRCTVLYRYPGDPAYPTSLSEGNVREVSSTPIPTDPLVAPRALPVAARTDTPALSPVATVPEPVVDAGPQNDRERLARSLSLGELVMETKRGSATARATARQELKRRGIAAGGRIIMAEDDEQQTGTVVVALPAEDDPCRGIGAEDKHATILFLGDGLSPEAVTAVVDAVRGWVDEQAAEGEVEPFTESVSGVESLGDGGARVWMLDAGTLPDLHANLRDLDAIRPLWDAADQFPTYTPHVTIGYPAADPETVPEGDRAMLDEETEAAAADVSSIHFDRLAVWSGPDRTVIPLTTTEEPAMPDTDEAVAAAAGDPAPAVSMDAGDPAPMIAEDVSGDLSDRFHGVMLVEDRQTGDGRVFQAGAVEWDGLLPMPLGWQVEDAPGHDGSVIVGRIDTITRVGNAIQYEGTWDVEGYGWEPRRMVDGQFLRGISVDVDDAEAVVVTEDGEVMDGLDLMFMGEDGILVVQRGRIRSAALCRVPALAPLDGPDSVFIANGTWADAGTGEEEDPEEDPEGMPPEEMPDDAMAAAALIAAATRADLPARTLPPAEWFGDPQFGATPAEDPRLVELPDRPGQYAAPFTITDDGRVFGHMAAWGTCHIGIQGQCVTPPESLAAYAYFLTGQTETTAGYVPTGSLTMETGHADLSLRARPAAAHYDNTGTAFADVAVGEDAHGIWYTGRLRASVTPEQREALLAAGALSGDWRKIGNGLELVASLAVNVPGFPVPRVSVAASGAEQTALVAAGMVATPPVHLPPVRPGESIHALVRRALRVERAAARIETNATRARNRRVQALTARMERNH